jgi:hypothetical protein
VCEWVCWGMSMLVVRLASTYSTSELRSRDVVSAFGRHVCLACDVTAGQGGSCFGFVLVWFEERQP